MPVRDEDFELFIEDFGEATIKESVSGKSLKKYKGVLPDQLLHYWKTEGWNAYSDGLFWIVNPEEYNDLVELWLEDTHYPKIDNYHCIARTSFGVLYVWGERNNQWFTISCPTNTIVAFDKTLLKVNKDPNSSIRSFFASSLPIDRDLKDLKRKMLTPQSFKKLGHLKADEVYGFAPALAAGGSQTIDNVEKEDLFIHLSILREMAPPSLPYSDVDVDALMKDSSQSL